MEAPFLRIDPILEAFAKRHRCQIVQNYRSAERAIRFNDDLERAMWIHTMDKYGTDGRFQVSIIAHIDRRGQRYIKAAIVGDPASDEDLLKRLERATEIVMTWGPDDLEIPAPPKERKEMERIY